MNVFVDFHHASLLNSFILLFEKRLGGKVHRPIGREWYDKGFWKVFEHPETVAQYLDVGGATPDNTPRLNEVVPIDVGIQKAIGNYLCQDIDSGTYNNAITYENFMDQHFDIVIASLPQHIEPYKRLCLLHPSRPKLIFQIGNQWDGKNTALNIMASVKMNPVAGTHFIQYHQEFDTNIFKPSTTITKAEYFGMNENIYSFVNVFNGQSHFASDWNLFEEVERRMDGWNFKSYGGQCRDGAAHGSQELASKMREAKFIWHTKNGGDGYGHVLFNSAAVGRPIITKKSYYQGKLGEELMLDGQTCIAIDNLSVEEIIGKINHYSKPEHYTRMCAAVYDNFKRVCNFDEEFIKIKEFLANLQ